MPDAMFNRLFVPPPIPGINLPLPGRLARPVLQVIAWAVESAFRVGVYQGFIAGALATLIVIQGLSAARNRIGR